MGELNVVSVRTVTKETTLAILHNERGPQGSLYPEGLVFVRVLCRF